MLMTWYKTGTRYRVTGRDETTYLSTLTRWRDPSEAGGVADEDVLLGAGPGSQSESYRVFHNSRVTPFTGEFDGRLHVYARNASYIKLFRGSDATGNGTVISAIYDQSNQLISNNIPLELVHSPTGENLAIKAPAKFWITQKLTSGEPVTAIVYNSDGQPLSASKLLILETENYMHGGAAVKYITSIRLESQFMAAGEENLIQMPMTMPVQSAMFMGVVQYSDGTSLTLPVDGSKFTLAGINSYVASELGQRVPVQLIYRLSPEENAADVGGTESYRFMAEDYTVETVEAKTNYNVKLFSYPVWDPATTKYTLRHYLTNLDREEVWDVTSATRLSAQSPAYQGDLYNAEQSLIFVVELSEVDSIFADFRHVAPIGINLIRSGTQTGAKWAVRFTPGQPLYGAELIATCAQGGGTGERTFNVANGYTNTNDWLNAVFYATEPVHNPQSEALAPEPTHFTLVAGNVSVTRTVDQFSDPIEIQSGAFPQGGTITLQFERHVGTDIFRLGVSGMPVDNI